jgi:hypothetical protein
MVVWASHACQSLMATARADDRRSERVLMVLLIGQGGLPSRADPGF